jgi:hypothetical protein
LLDLICLNSVLNGATLVVSTRKPFNCLVEGLVQTESGEEGTRLQLFLAGFAENSDMLAALTSNARFPPSPARPRYAGKTDPE